MSAKDLRGLFPVPVITLPLLPLSNKASTASCSIRFSFLTIISGALNSINLFNRLFLLITLRYRSLRSDVANLPPSSGTKGLSSGGITGITVKIIHSGLFPELIKFSTSFNLLIVLSSATLEVVVFKTSLNLSLSAGKSIAANTSLIASAPIPAENWSSPYFSWAFNNSSSVINWFFLNSVNPGSITIKFSKYKTFSRSLSFMSIARAILLGNDFKNQIWETGVDSSTWPIRSRLTFALVTSTPHFSQIIPLNFIRLYLPHKHS